MVTRTCNTISICSGYGGIELGIREIFPIKVICYVERELSTAEILRVRMQDKALDEAPIWSDLKTFDTREWDKKVDMLIGGFPCQPFAESGKQLGAEDRRNLWPDTARVIRELGVSIFFLENVTGILRYYWDTIRPELREMGYEVTEGIFTAEETGAPQERERLFIMGVSKKEKELAYPTLQGLEGIRFRRKGSSTKTSKPISLYPPKPEDSEGWRKLIGYFPELEPSFCKSGEMHTQVSKNKSKLFRTSYGPSKEVDIRLRAIGNGVVPAVAAVAFRELRKNLIVL